MRRLIYEYLTDTFGDDWLHAPINDAENDPERGKPYGPSHVEFCPDGTPEPRTPAIDVEKVAVATPIAAGDVARFTFDVTNTGNVEFFNYVFSDPICDGGNATQTSGETDSTLGVGEVRTYACSVDTAESDTAAVDNTVCVEGMDAGGKVGENEVEDCDSATVELTPTMPTTTRPATTTPTTTTTPATTTPASGTLPETIASGRARLRGPSGCVDQAFRASVTGRSIASVRFYVDGKLVKKFTGERASYSVKVNPRNLGIGRHRVVARVRFDAASATPGRTLPLTFRRCAQQVAQPRFTG